MCIMHLDYAHSRIVFFVFYSPSQPHQHPLLLTSPFPTLVTFHLVLLTTELNYGHGY